MDSEVNAVFVYILRANLSAVLKILCSFDFQTHYLLNAFVYIGKNVNANNLQKLHIPTQLVLEVIALIMHSKRNVTGDNWFSFMELLNELRTKGLTYVWTVRKNKHSFYPIKIVS